MKFDSRRRLTDLESQRRMKLQDARSAQQFRNDIIAALGVARSDLEREKSAPMEFRPTAKVDGKDSPQAKIDILAERVRELEEAEVLAAQRWEAANASAMAVAQLADACRAFASSNGLPLPVDLPLLGPDPMANAVTHGGFK